jgi:hypothetical protein
VKYLKLFESFNKEDIDSICERYGIENYTINEDGTIDVDGCINLTHKGLTELPLKFRNVTGYFWCSANELSSLEGCPESVGGYFSCSRNKLKTLEGCPKSVGGSFRCSRNQLMTLEGLGRTCFVSGNVFCDDNPCTRIYEEWIDSDRKEELMDMMKDYDFLRGDIINWYLLEEFYKDAGLKIPNRKELEKYYTIEE